MRLGLIDALLDFALLATSFTYNHMSEHDRCDMDGAQPHGAESVSRLFG